MVPQIWPFLTSADPRDHPSSYLPLGAAPLPVAPFPMPLPAAAPGVLTGGPPLVPGAPVRIAPPCSCIFCDSLFTLPGLFMLPSALPRPAGVCARAEPATERANRLASVSVFMDMAFSPERLVSRSGNPMPSTTRSFGSKQLLMKPPVNLARSRYGAATHTDITTSAANWVA